MYSLPEPISALIAALNKLPGIGPRSAERIALHLAQTQTEPVRQLAQAILTARGCRWQRLEQREGEWFFTCSVPSRTSPNSVKTYEATDKFGLLAMQKVIDEINRDQSR